VAITPWLSNLALRSDDHDRPAANSASADSRIHRFYERVLGPLLDDGRKARRLLVITGALLVAALLLAVVRAVPLKMLPFDNKNEFQVLLQADEGTTLERTDAIARTRRYAAARAVRTSSDGRRGGPIDFNGLVRHYFLRSGTRTSRTSE
jgi:multidrug efflux pump subunit AcrB